MSLTTEVSSSNQQLRRPWSWRLLAGLGLAGAAWYVHLTYGAEIAFWLRLVLGIVLVCFSLACLIYLIRLILDLITQTHLKREHLRQEAERTRLLETDRQKAEAEARLIQANAAKAERDSEFFCLVARHDEAVFIRDLNPLANWKPGHLIPKFRFNGTPITPSELELNAWREWQSHGNNAALPRPPALLSTATWPERIRLDELLTEIPSLSRLVLGITLNPTTGQVQIVTGDMHDLIHIAIGGSSGWGKSVLVRVLTYQLLLAREPLELVLIDLEPNALAPFAGAVGRLRYPLANTEATARDVLAALKEEMLQRIALFAQAGVDDLEEYNRWATEPLKPIVCVADEANDLLEIEAIENDAQLLARRGRKAGIWIILAAQEWKVAVIDARIRRQLSTKIQFRANDPAQARMLVGRSGASLLADVPPGRAVASLPGQGIIQIQAPYLSKADIQQVVPLTHLPQPVIELPPAPLTPEEARIQKLFLLGWSISNIAADVYGSKGGPQNERVRRVLRQLGLFEPEGQDR